MRIRFVLPFLILISIILNQPALCQSPENLLKNGDFESGEIFPEAWERPDRLTVFLVKEPSPSNPENKCLKMDTDVYMTDWEKRKKEMEKNLDTLPWTKTPTKGKKYNTIGGNNGVSLYSDPIPVETGTTYTLSLDVKSHQTSGTPKIFVKGYTLHKGRMREIYKTYLNCRFKGTDWQHFEQNFHPTSRTPRVTEMRVMIFSYWPPGEYRFDNIQVFK
ncbi:carbohydrate binding domain-containing protein [Candidatus Sumerlaeota bacterium]|nr:carbohydrate binding domain-containing protein [Candidatus Sumerlaeota bacterium]